MVNEVIEMPMNDRSTALALTRDGVDALKANRQLLMEFVRSQLREDIDFGVISGTQKPSLYKPGGEKLRTLFSLQTETVRTGMELDRPGNFAMVTYLTTVKDKNGNLLATCEGSCNSQEKKYRERRARGGGVEATPVCDVLNTLMKMAQKRSFVGAVILATGASDFFTQDIDDAEDAAALGVGQRPEPSRASVVIPKPLSATSQTQSAPTPAAEPSEDGPPVCQLCSTTMQLSRNKDAYTCPNWKDKSRGDHSYVPI